MASLQVILPAALLGVGAIWMCQYLPLPARHQPIFFLVHGGLALIYPLTWIFVVSGIGNIQTSLARRAWTFTLPPAHILHWHFLAGSMIYVTLVSVTYLIDRTVQAEARRRQAEIWTLRAQLNPHFLFNTLHSLLALVRHDADAAEKALEQFAGLLRYTLRVHRDKLDEVEFSEEWAFTRDYLELERLRLGDRLHLEVNIDSQLMNCLVPAFLLQPIVENAIRYAVAPRASGGTIRIQARHEAEGLEIIVSDDGPGALPEALQSSGVGLQVVRERLASFYGKDAHFAIATEPGQGFAVTMRIPLRDEL